MQRRKSYLLIAGALVFLIGYNVYGRGHQAMLHRLLQAAGRGDTASVRSLLRLGFSPNAKEAGASPCGSPAVVAAACGGQTETLRLLLDHGGDVNARGPEGQTALALAIQQGRHDAALLLLQRGADPNLPSPEIGRSTLSAAAAAGWMDVVEKALARGVPPDGGTIGGSADRPLCFAAAAGQGEAVRLLLDRGASLDARLDNGMNALMCAAVAGRADVVDLLLRRGADVRAVDCYGCTPLIWAAYSGDLDTVKRLLQSGADINARDQDGLTPIVYAPGAGDPATVHFLLEKGADIRGRLGYAALLSAMQDGLKGGAVAFAVPEIRKRAMVRDLLAHGADPNPSGAFYKPRMKRLVDYGIPVNLYLLDFNSLLYSSYARGIAPVISSALQRRGYITRMLLQHGAEVDTRDWQGRTALMYAIARDNMGSVEALLSAGADVNTQDIHGRTVLEYALYWGNPEMVQRLVAQGVDVNATGDRPYTPLRIAMQGRLTRIVRILKQAGAKY